MLPEPFYKDELTTIYCGDAEKLLKEIGKVDAIVTDPPYGISAAKKGRVGGGKNNTAFSSKAKAGDYITEFTPKDWDAKTPPASMFKALMQCSKHQIIFGGNYFGLPGTSCYLVWDKENGTTDFADCELAWTNLHKAVRKLTYRWNGLLQEDQGNKEIRRHPTQKPVAVMEWCIKQLPKVDLILDPYMGSGSTLIAARRLGIKNIGIDLDPEYCEIAKKTICGELSRWQKPKLTMPDSMALEQLPLFKKDG